MPELTYIQPVRLSLKDHPQLDERWLQDRIAEDPSILGLGDVVLRDRERQQPRAGRLDLLLQNGDSNERYEVEVQLGKTDESHIIRTIEYWDVERKRYPQYDHVAVIVAEDITSRFLNVVSLFNGFIPLVAIQLAAFEWENTVSLAFTTVLDQTRLGLVDEDEGTTEVTDRQYWESRGTPATVAMVDTCLHLMREIDPDIDLNYTKFYIGPARAGRAINFALFRPQKKKLVFELRLERSEDAEAELMGAGLDVDYDGRRGRYRIGLTESDLDQHGELLKGYLEMAYKERV